MRDYVAWHDAYGDPASPLSRRLAVVIRLIGDVLDRAAPGPVRFISLCAGQGDDVLAVAAAHPRGHDLVGRLVELDQVNAETASGRIHDLALTGIEVARADAGSTDACTGAVPADLVVACGIFGNVPSADIERTIRALPSLCSPGAWVVWTRHPRDASVLDAIDLWFAEAGFERESLVVDEEQGYSVGLHRLAVAPAPFSAGVRLFTFVR